jgi:HEAT repeat protein
MWAKDLQAITYYEVNDFEADYQSLSDQAGNELGPQPKPSEPLTPATLEEAPWNRITTETEELKPSITLTAEDLAEVRDLTLAVDDEVFLKRAGEVLTMTLEIENVPEAYVDMETAFNAYIDTCLARKCLSLAAEMLRDLKQRYSKFKADEVQKALESIIDARHSEKNVAIIGEILSTGRETQCERCRMYLSELSEEAVPVIFKLLPSSSHQASRHALVSSLARIGAANPERIAKCAGREMAEEAELALEVLETIGTEKALAEAMSFAGNFSPKIRAKVALLASKLRTGHAQEVAETLINDEDHSVRRRALTTLAEITGDRCADTLIGLFTSKDFHQLSHDSKLSMLLVIRALSPVGQRRVIEAILKSRSLFKRKPMDDTKAAVTELAHLMDPEVAADCLRWLSKHSSGKLKQAARTTLEKVDHGNRTKR